MFFSIHSYPELRTLEVKDRQGILKDFYAKTKASYYTSIAFLIIVIGVCIPFSSTISKALFGQTSSFLFVLLTAAVLGGIGAGVLMTFLINGPIRK